MTIHVLIYGCAHCEEWGIEEVFDDINEATDKKVALDLEHKSKSGCGCGSYWVESWEVH